MKRFVYYFPGKSAMNPRMMATAGVLDRFTTSGGRLLEHTTAPCDDGPAGLGCVIAVGPELPRTAGIDWQPNDGWLHQPTVGWYVGIEDAAPSPDELERDIGLSGHQITLGDGCQWRIPLIHRWDAQALGHVPAVPSSLQMVSGKCERRVRKEYAAVDAIAAKTFKHFFAETTLPVEEAFADAAALLACNYRIGLPEVNLLGLLTDADLLKAVLGLAIDTPAIRQSAIDHENQGVQLSENQPALAEGSD